MGLSLTSTTTSTIKLGWDSTIIGRDYHEKVVDRKLKEAFYSYELFGGRRGVYDEVNYSIIAVQDNSFLEVFADTNYLNTTATTANGWGNRSVKLGVREPKGDPVIRNLSSYSVDVFYKDDYAYVARGSGLAIINVRDPTNPGNPIYSDKLDADGGIYISGDYAYVADTTYGLVITDISDPTNPGSPIYRAIARAQDVYVYGNYAYVADYNHRLAIINISDPTNPGLPIYIDLASYANSVCIDGIYAYVTVDSEGLAIVDISDPTNPGIPIYMSTEKTQNDEDHDAHSVYVNDKYAYVAAGSLVIIDISDPVRPGSPIYIDLPGFASDVHVNGVFAYVTFFYRSGLAIIDVSDPTNPGSPIIVDLPGIAHDLYVNGDYTYITGDNFGLAIIDTVKWNSVSLVQSTSCFTSEGFVQNITLYANQTVFPNTNIIHQISSDGNTWIPVTLEEPFSFTMNRYHELYWRAELMTEDTKGPSPFINSIKLEYDVYIDEDPPIVKLMNVQNDTTISPRTLIEVAVSDFTLDQCWYHWDNEQNRSISVMWTISTPLREGSHILVIHANDSVGYLTTQQYLFHVNYPENLLSSPRFEAILLFCFIGAFLIFSLSFQKKIYSKKRKKTI